MTFKRQKAHLLTAKSFVEEPIEVLDRTKVLDGVINQYRESREKYKQSCLTSDVIILESKILVCDEKRNSFFRRVSNIILNLWNKIVSYFCSSTSSKVVPAQNHEGVSEESTEKAEKVKPALKEKLESRDEKIDDLSERIEKLEESSTQFETLTKVVNAQVQGPGGRWNFL